MAKYSSKMKRTASTTLSVGSITVDATTVRRFKLYDLLVGSDGTPVDSVFLWEVQRCTTAGTNTGVTLRTLDPADAAALTDSGENHSADPTVTANEIPISIPLNQRATFRWMAAPGGEIVVPATASNGLAIRTPTAGSLISVVAVAHIEEQ